MTHAQLSEMGLDLSSRSRARALREEFLREAGQKPEKLTFDFRGVRTLSDSFADELLAVIVQQRGVSWFKERVKLVNLSPEFRFVVVSAIQTRLHKTSQSEDDQLHPETNEGRIE